MKKLLFSISIFLISTSLIAQTFWTASGTNLYYNGGNVGIGTATPTSKLQVNGVFSLNKPALMQDGQSTLGVTSGTSVSFAPSDLSSTNNSYFSIKFPTNTSVRFATDYDGHLGVGIYRDIEFGRISGNPYLIIKDGGNVGIGTAPGLNQKLAVEGTIGARAVKVTLAVWSDYVFYPNYNLTPIFDLENYIKINKHLPGIPSEDEVKKNGIDLGQMNAELLKKIEELTLYVIELKKESESMKNEIQILNSKGN